ncbi:MAG TPA: ABC-2 family transporter protein [Chthoniobacteraceae bacterium]|nr:ABC-2 family transporter protein [Chthoniobacteraceae bacterium]
MRPTLEKYGKVFDVGLQNTFVYRWNFLLRSLFALAPLAGTVLIWQAIFSESGSVGSYGYHQMIWYFLLVLLVDNLVTPTEDEWQIAADIRDGQMNAYLVKPFNYIAYRFSLFLSYRLIYTLVTLLPVAAIFFWFREVIVWPSDWTTWPVFGLSVALSAALSFLIAYCVALMAFWVLEISTLLFIVYSFEYFLSGQTFPLDIMPLWFQNVLMFTPFPYQMFFPVQIVMERVAGEALWRGLAIQTAWVAAVFALSQFLWSRGVRKYQAYGG